LYEESGLGGILKLLTFQVPNFLTFAGSRALGLSGSRALGLSGSRALGLSGSRALGLLGSLLQAGADKEPRDKNRLTASSRESPGPDE